MTAVWFRLATEQRYHRMLTVGVVRHVTGCREIIDATDAVVITATEPPPDLACPCCWRDFEVRRARATTRDLRPHVREIGVIADLEVEVAQEPVVARAMTGEW